MTIYYRNNFYIYRTVCAGMDISERITGYGLID